MCVLVVVVMVISHGSGGGGGVYVYVSVVCWPLCTSVCGGQRTTRVMFLRNFNILIEAKSLIGLELHQVE